MNKQSGNSQLPLVILAVLALALVPLLLSLKQKTTAPKAQTCTADQCSTASGCQARGYQQEGYVCVGNNQWQGPDGNITTFPANAAQVACEADSCSYRRKCVKKGAGASLPEGRYTCLGSNTWQSPNGTVTNSLPSSADKLPAKEVKLIRNIPTVNPSFFTKNEYTTIAKDALNWVGTQKNARGVYSAGTNCSNESGKCSESVDNPRIVPQLMWGRYQYAKAMGDQSEVDALVNDLTALMSLYDDPNYAISYLNNLPVCSMLYELFLSDVIDGTVKLQMQDLCEKSNFAGEIYEEAIRNIAQQVFSEPNISQVMLGSKLPYESIINNTDFLNGYYTYSVSASDLATQSRWFNDSTKLQYAKHFFQKALQIYSNERTGSLLKGQSSAVIGIASLDIFLASNESQYLDFASYVAKQKNQQGCISTDDCTAFGLLLNKLIEQTNDNTFKNMQSQLVQKIISRAYDSEAKAFDSMSKFVRHFDVKNNAVIAGILSKFAIIQ